MSRFAIDIREGMVEGEKGEGEAVVVVVVTLLRLKSLVTCLKSSKYPKKLLKSGS